MRSKGFKNQKSKVKRISFLLTILISLFSNLIFYLLPERVEAVFSAESKLAEEVQKIISAGHLKPGYFSGGMLDIMLAGKRSDYFMDYFHNPAETIYTLSIAYPYLPSNLQTQVRTYLQNEYNNYPLNSISHIGWGSGVSRDLKPWPNDLVLSQSGTSSAGWGSFWSFPPFNFYAAWKYAQVMGNASSVYSSMQSRASILQNPPADSVFTASSFLGCPAEVVPHVLNAWIAGYIGYLELQKMATGTQDQALVNQRDRLINLRLSLLDGAPESLRAIEGGGFIYLVPELGERMYQAKRSRVQTYIDTYNDIMPYWMKAGAEEQIKDPNNCMFYAEGSNQILQVTHSLFLAKAYALKETRSQLELYLDMPYFERGDLYYIQNLVATIQAGPGGSTNTPIPSISEFSGKPADANSDGLVDGNDFSVWLKNYSRSLLGRVNGDFNNSGLVEITDYYIWVSNYTSF